MSELAVYIPSEIAITPQDLVNEAAIPLLPASKIARGTFHPDRIPPDFARTADVAAQIQEAIQGLGTGESPSEEIDALFEAVEGKADVNHTHPDLITAIDSKADANHTHAGLPIVSATAPSSPTIGQRWIDTTDQMVWFWNSTHWVSQQVFSQLLPTIGGSLTSSEISSNVIAVDRRYNLWLDRWTIDYQTTGTFYNADNKYVVTLSQLRFNQIVTEAELEVIAGVQGQWFNQVVTFDTFREVLNQNLHGFQITWSRWGTPSAITRVSANLTYRLAK